MSAGIDPSFLNLEPLPGTRAVLTNGCFDLFHVGHVRFLERAAMFGTRLIVAVNSDHSVRMLKGEGRPVQKLGERMELLAALSCVSLVTSFPDNDVSNVIRHIQPHCWIKGGDYTMESLNKLEVQAAKHIGCAIVILPRFGDYSTTGILDRMKGLKFPEAALAYNKAAILMHGTAARLNKL